MLDLKITKKTNNGFTLTEVLVVIAITSILFAIIGLIMVSFNTLIKNTDHSIDISDQKKNAILILDKITDYANKEGKTIRIDRDPNLVNTFNISLSQEGDPSFVTELEIKMVNEELTFIYHENTYTFKDISNIDITEQNTKLIKVVLTIEEKDTEKLYRLVNDVDHA